MTVGQHINNARNKRGITIDELAEKANVSRDTICGWIYRDNHPSVVLLMAVADVLEMSLDELVGREKPNEH